MEGYLTVAEICAYLGCGKTWIYDKLQYGKIRGYKIAGKWQVAQEDLNKYIKSCHNAQKRS